MDLCCQLGYMDIRWKKKYALEATDAYMETMAFNGDPQLHMTVVVELHPSFIKEYNEKMEAFAVKRIKSSNSFILSIDMRQSNIDLETHLDFLKQVGNVHEVLYDKYPEYTKFMKAALIFVPNKVIAQSLSIAIHMFFKPVVKLLILSVEDVENISIQSLITMGR